MHIFTNSIKALLKRILASSTVPCDKHAQSNCNTLLLSNLKLAFFILPNISSEITVKRVLKRKIGIDRMVIANFKRNF